MRSSRRQFMTGAALAVAAAAAARSQGPKPRLRRKDCFVGMHFDLHPAKSDTALGRDVSEAMIDRFLEAVGPDYVQYDCKGHAGYLGYPSTVGTSSPGIVRDSLELWRRVTERRGVALFIHFSGLWDSLALEQHPDWAVVLPDGKRDSRATSTFGPYVDRLMIPQLEEVSERYHLDGAWIDGECWATRPDYSPAAAAAFEAATGLKALPKGPEDRGWLEFLELNREQFRKYVRHYREVLQHSRPNFQVASNWLYTTFVPERPDIPVDFISGDYLGNASISTARLESRYLSSVGRPWDLMAWGFQQGSGPAAAYTHKPAIQLQQEASVVLAQGGGFQVYYQPTRAGRIDERLIGTMAQVARFCRARQAPCHKSETVPQIGVIFSTRSLYRTTGKMFGGWGSATDPARGFVDALVDSGFSVDVIPEWRLPETARDYPLLVVPDWPDTGEAVRDAVVARVRSGGCAIIAGAANTSLFASATGLQLSGPAVEKTWYISGKEVFANVTGLWQPVSEPAGSRLRELYPTIDSSQPASAAAVLTEVGRGQVVTIPGPLGALYARSHGAALRQFVASSVAKIFTPLVRIDAPPAVELVLRRKGGRLLIHLLNAAGMQVAADYIARDFVPPVGPIAVHATLPKAPVNAVLEPGGKLVSGHFANGVWSATIPRLELHDIIAIS